MKQQIFRQGDVLLVVVDSLPKNAKDITPKKRIVLAYGEATGHAHAIEAEPSAGKVRLWDAGAERFLQVLEGKAWLRHEEHAPIELSPGIYRVGNQVEYTPKEIRRVSD
jgi:hypothetical protein